MSDLEDKNTENTENSSNIKTFGIIGGIVVLAIALRFLMLYYYQSSFDKTLSSGSTEEIQALLNKPEFLEHATREQGQKVINFYIDNAKTTDNDKKFALFKNNCFKKFNDKAIGEKLVVSVYKNIDEKDSNTIYRLLNEPYFETFGNKDQSSRLINILVADSSVDKYGLLANPAFNKYGSQILGSQIVASLAIDILPKTIDDKFKFLQNTSVKNHLTADHRNKIIDSIIDTPVTSLGEPQLNKFFFEICTQQDWEKVNAKLDKNKLPDSFVEWVISKISNTAPNSNKANNLNALIKDSPAAARIIIDKARNIFKEYETPDKVSTVVDAYPWAFNERTTELINVWREGLSAIEQVKRNYGSAGYSAIQKLKDKRDRIPEIQNISGKILSYGGKFKNYYDGVVRECYEVSLHGIYALLYTDETSYYTTGYFEIWAELIDMRHVPELQGIPVYYEISKSTVRKYNDEYNELTSQIAKLEAAAETYEDSLDNAKSAVKYIKTNLQTNFDEQYQYWSTQPDNGNRATNNSNLMAKDKVFKVKGVEFVMMHCPAGSFEMGSPSGELGRYDDEKQHHVTISKSFYIAKYEVTQAQYKAVMGKNPFRFEGDNNPVECVSWFKAKEFCDKLNEVTGSTRPAGYKFDLPTEAQWEYACRAGTTTSLNSGKNITSENGRCSNLDEVGWYDGNSESKTHPVGLKKPNAWGIYDMHGNVWEWCRDWYGDYPSGNCTDPEGPSNGSNRVYRGGGWCGDPRDCRSACRSNYNPDSEGDGLGFRFALVPKK